VRAPAQGTLMERPRGNGPFVLLIILGLGAAAGAVWFHRHQQVRALMRNESNAVSALWTISTAEADFRANDRDWNGVHDFWTGDVAGLHTVTGRDGWPIQLLGQNIAAADARPLRPAAVAATPYHGYYFFALDADDSNPDEVEKIYRQDTGGKRPSGKVHHQQAFGFCAYPAVPGETGRYAYIINEYNTIFRRALPGPAPKNWPADQELMRRWTSNGW